MSVIEKDFNLLFKHKGEELTIGFSDDLTQQRNLKTLFQMLSTMKKGADFQFFTKQEDGQVIEINAKLWSISQNSISLSSETMLIDLINFDGEIELSITE